MRRALTSVGLGTASRFEWKAAYLSWSLAMLSILIVLFSFGLAIYLAITRGEFNSFISHQMLTPFITIAFACVGGLVASHHARNPIGWIFLSVGILYALNSVTAVYNVFGSANAGGNPLPASVLMSWLGSWIWVPAIILPTAFVFLYFPDGRLMSRGWRYIAWSAAIGLALSVLVIMLHPGPLSNWDVESNPFGFPGAAPILNVLDSLGVGLLGIGFVGSFIAFILRFRRTRGAEREQMKWLLYALCLMAFAFLIAAVIWFIFPENELVGEFSIALTSLSILGIAVAATIAILRYRLYDIDLIINRTLVYTLLTAGVLGIYVLAVGSVSLLFQQTNNLVVSLFATGLAALLIQPLRDRLQSGINRLMYGERDDPYAVLSGLDRRLEASFSPDSTLPIVVETISQTLKLPYVAVELAAEDGFISAASYGLSPTRKDQHYALPLIYQNNRIGRLVFSPRSSGGTFNQAEMKLLQDIARHVSAAANSVQLTANLQRSRERIVTAREEERRRLSRDLHDGLGPQLVSLGFKVEAAQNLLDGSQPEVGDVLAQLKTQTQSALANVRRIAYHLRPPALDQLGLVPAIQEHVTSLERPAEFQIRLDAPDHLPSLPAAVEVAAYRVIIEAVTNVTIHAQASSCIIRLRAKDHLIIEISDNGRGLPENLVAGVGLNSMRERVEELGGSFTIAAMPGRGTQVIARLPLQPYANAAPGGEQL